MKNAFTLIELIFVIVILGLLGSIAVPKFQQSYASAKSSSAKSVVASLRTAIEVKHGENIISDSDENYPFPLDNAELNKSGEHLFNNVLGTNYVNSCNPNGTACWYKDDNSSDPKTETYGFKFKKDTTLKVRYYESNGSLECIDGDNFTLSQCESVIDR